jgi:hypothetical protein
MNEANQITQTTRLFGFIAEAAQQNRFSVTLNRRFKNAGDDAMMIPMNIRPDDFHYTVANMKQSHLKGAVFGFEYQVQAMELLDGASALCERAGLCDTVTVENGMLFGELLFPEALKKTAERAGANKVALIGHTPLAGAFGIVFEGMEVAFYDEWIEGLMALQERIGRPIDINRLAPGMQVDLSAYDMLIDLSGGDADLSMVTALPALNVEMSTAQEHSALQRRCSELGSAYSGYDTLLDDLTASAYTFVTARPS